MRKIKVAIIGIGHLGSHHLKIYDQLRSQVDLIGVCDIKEDRTRRLAQHYRIPYFKNYQELADQIEAVNICVPTSQHFEIAKFFLRHNVHTLIEKPITQTVEQADQLIQLAQENNLKLQVGHIERFNSAFEAIKDIAQDPLFIECHRLNPFPHRSLDIGVVMDLMIHDLDIILGLIHAPIKEIHAIGINVLTPLEDIASVRIEFENGCVCNLTASRISEDVMRKIRIFLKDSYISLDYVRQEAFIYRKQARQILKNSLPIEKQEPLKKELVSFVDCIRENKIPVVTGQDARQALKIALDIKHQIWKTAQRYKDILEEIPSS